MPCRTALVRCLVIAALALLAGCTATGQHPGDPYEANNRAALEQNLWLYDNAIEPVVRAYRWAVPDPLRQGVSNFIDNLATPRIFVNDLLQAEWERAAETLTRFAFNSTIGFGGLFDRATQMGIPRHDEDFGQTLAVYGVGDQPYMVFLLLGPSNPRDTTGYLVDLALDPVNYLLFPLGAAANVTGTTFEQFSRDPDRVEALRVESVDFYTTLRSAYRQQRAHEIGNGAAPADAGLDEMDDPADM